MVHIRIQNGKGIPGCVASHVVTSTTAYVASQMRPCSGRVPVMSIVGVGTLPPKDLSDNILSKLPMAALFLYCLSYLLFCQQLFRTDTATNVRNFEHYSKEDLFVKQVNLCM